MLIGELAEKTNVSVDTIRYYEREGLIDPVSVRDSGYREFDEGSVEAIFFVVRAKDLGFSLKEICTLLRLKSDPDTTCGEVKALAEKKITDVIAKIKNLQAIQRDLAALISKCTDTAASVDECPIVDSLDKKEKEI